MKGEGGRPGGIEGTRGKRRNGALSVKLVAGASNHKCEIDYHGAVNSTWSRSKRKME